MLNINISAYTRTRAWCLLLNVNIPCNFSDLLISYKYYILKYQNIQFKLLFIDGRIFGYRDFSRHVN